MKEIHVVAGIIYNDTRDQILIAKRPDHLHQGGLWEFPGGKVDEGESVESALQRELLEELDIGVSEAEPFQQIAHRYPDKAVFLDFWKVYNFSGQPDGLEGQEVRWVNVDILGQYAFPEANVPIVKMLME